MGKKLRAIRGLALERPARLRLSPRESLKRMKDFAKRKEKLVAAIRESKN